ncbi:T9SS type A sorting domain-containing protein [Tamlana fucoidanivorans]|uniref:T9SS type A sorting domain-containing protein n=1 Tax=Allotamlana fucoidanivorans TaxID=2583814 RepID=A0A5C4SJ47_9FLAO|nr:T9SS type A sorting domain-containing protein [Tamlana fucoidanivorans]TNJ43856.1 T9SS type A sorting domain-containing protein [Tamlana fucoidanivorans]
MKHLIFITCLISICFIFQANAQFELSTKSSVRGLRNGTVTFTDFDSDGDLDILIFGNDILANVYSLLYLNDNLELTENGIDNFPNLNDGNLDWADYNNDGKMDLAIIGHSPENNGAISRVLTYESEFVDSNIELPGVSRGSIDWGDYNNDGQEDILIVGQDNSSASITKIFENKDSVFTEIDLPSVEGVSFGSASWVDYDGDGLLDFMITGVTGVAPNTGDPITRLYRQTETGFELVFENTFEGVRLSSIDWGDADNDGDLDLLLTGLTASSQNYTGLYINNITSFTEMNTGLPNVIEGFAKWADYDNDGDLDILITGNVPWPDDKVCKVFSNDLLTFTEVFSVEGVGQSSGGWADFNNDGYLDFFINGQKSNFDLEAAIYLNTTLISSEKLSSKEQESLKVTNTAPSTPSGLSEEIIGNKLKLTWNASSDDKTMQSAITYSVNLYKDGELYIPSLSNSDGFRTIVEPGNAGANLFFITDNLPNGNYTWSVQAIDNTFSASSFSNISGGITLSNNTLIKSPISIFPNPTKNKLYLSLNEQGGSYQLINLLGKVVSYGNLKTDYINLEGVSSGAYLLMVQLNSQTIVKRIVKQ